MEFFTLLQQHLWITILCFADFYVSVRDCTVEMEPVIDPPSLVVKYGDPASAICRTQHNAFITGWEAPVEATRAAGSHQAVWEVSSLTNWSLAKGITCYGIYVGYAECLAILSITIYKIPERVTLSHSDPVLKGAENRLEFSLECDVKGVAPVENLTVIWFRGHTELGRSEFPQLYRSDDVTVRANLSIIASREDNKASYSCAAQLDLNTAEPIPDTRSNSVLLEDLYKYAREVSGGDVRLTEGDTLKVNYTSDANPGVMEPSGELPSVGNSRRIILGVVVVVVLVLILAVVVLVRWKCFKKS
ncbi:uncharacterized protein LOC121718632 [Alosa sapidissima]|uniref:uncharacterized protein LOC121718632 n=1 Tax=Alosa sapidissima TaxID=34773 RepID=UPI001C098C32|nr:uncharacterized protein LOC121718632 [Alosa sapidissima]XP_041959652.1 uncharacterized protein LOC121718632 [Alosa sapidissima]